MHFIRWSAISAPATLLLLFTVVVYVPAAQGTGGPHWGANYFPNVPLTTQDGKQVLFYDDLLKGKTVAIALIYTHCQDECPLETARMAEVQRMLGDRVGKDIFFYSISIDPERDTPAALRAYAEKYHAGPGWLFLTGKKEDVDLISKKLGLYSDPDPANRDGHTAALMVGNEPAGQWMRNSATDNPRYLAIMIGNLLNNWKDRKTPASKTYAEAPTLAIKSKGQYLFATRCAACHTVGHGDKIGPDLLGITGTRDRAWLARFIATPDQMLAAKDPIATALFTKYKQVQMPNLRLDDEAVADLISFLEAQTADAGNRAAEKDASRAAKDGGMKMKPGETMQ